MADERPRRAPQQRPAQPRAGQPRAGQQRAGQQRPAQPRAGQPRGQQQRPRPQQGVPKGGTSKPGTGKAKQSAAKKTGVSPAKVWIRRGSFVVVLAIVASVGGVFMALNSVEVPVTDRQSANNSFMCLADVGDGDCNAETAVAQMSASGSKRIEVTLDEVSPNLINAVIAAEDRSFFKHNGVDAWGIIRAAYRSFAGSASRQGGSTITQQYVKMTYLSNEGTLTRKFNEAGIALKIEREMTKPEILEAYLNEAPFGRGAVGIEAASRTYFSKAAKDLTIPESAYLAGLLRAPSYADEPTNPDKPAEAKEAARRRRTVLSAMLEMGYISQKDFDTYDKVPFEEMIDAGDASGTGITYDADFRTIGGEYIVSWVNSQLTDQDLPTYVGEKAVFGGGIKVYLEVDKTLQFAAYLSTKQALDELPGPAAAMMSVDRDGRVLAMIGGQDFASSELNLALGQETGGSGRQPGSTMKPVALAAYVAAGYSIKNEFWSPPKVTFLKADGVTVDWEPKNYNDADDGLLTVESATWKSSNTVYAQIMKKIGIKAFTEMAQNLGIMTPQKQELGAVLGTTDTSLLEMAVAYATLGNHGERRQPHIIRRVESATGEVLYDAASDPRTALAQAIDPGVADTVAGVLTGSVHTGTGANASIKKATGVDAAGKTGTTSDNKDAWFAGFACGVTSVFWMGYPNVDPATGTIPQMFDKNGKGVTGGSYPANMWRTFMTQAVKGRDNCKIDKPDYGTIMEPVDPTFGPTTTTTVPLPTDTTIAPDQPGGATTTTVPGRTSPTTTAAAPTQPTSGDPAGGAAAN